MLGTGDSRPERRGGLYDSGVVASPESHRGKAFSKCTQVPLAGALAKTPAMSLNPFKQLIDIYLEFEILSAWIASRYYS